MQDLNFAEESQTDLPLDDLVQVLSDEDLLLILDARARELLGISGEEFQNRWRAGVYAQDPDRPGLAFLVSLLVED